MESVARSRGVLVSHAMTEGVVVVRPDAPLSEAVRVLRGAAISGVPVVDLRGRLVGVLSEKDIARTVGEVTGVRHAGRMLDLLAEGKRRGGNLRDLAEETLENTKVAEVMSLDPIVTSPSTPLDVAARIMLERRINRLPVVEGERLVGILTRHDILAASL